MIEALDQGSAHPTSTTLGRFGVRTLVDSAELFVASISMSGLVNPITGAPTLGPLAVVVDYVAGLVNHYRRTSDEWTVSTELSMELTPDALDSIARDSHTPVIATARPVGPKGATSLGRCELTHGDTPIGFGLVRSAHIRAAGETLDPEERRAAGEDRPSQLGDIMALRVSTAENGAPLLVQTEHEALTNTLGTVHGGVAATGLELAASAMLNHDRRAAPLQTASLRVVFSGRFFGGAESRYESSILRRTGRSGLGCAQAVNTDGSVALTGWVTAYR